jgi:hypothetical protein
MLTLSTLNLRQWVGEWFGGVGWKGGPQFPLPLLQQLATTTKHTNDTTAIYTEHRTIIFAILNRANNDRNLAPQFRINPPHFLLLFELLLLARELCHPLSTNNAN